MVERVVDVSSGKKCCDVTPEELTSLESINGARENELNVFTDQSRYFLL